MSGGMVTPFGFTWGPLEVSRCFDDPKAGYVLEVFTEHAAIVVRVSPGGRVIETQVTDRARKVDDGRCPSCGTPYETPYDAEVEEGACEVCPLMRPPAPAPSIEAGRRRSNAPALTNPTAGGRDVR